MSILVTGGAGFIGSQLIDRLLLAGERVTNLDNFHPHYDPSVKRANVENHHDYATYRLIESDIRDSQQMSTIFGQGEFSEVIHLAAMAGVRASFAFPTLYEQVNVAGSLNLLEACRTHGIKRVILASSSSVYGKLERYPASESDKLGDPLSPYAATKQQGEVLAKMYSTRYGISILCLRFFSVYGPRQRPDMAIHRFTDQISRGVPVPLFGPANSSRDYTYITDILDGIEAARTVHCDYDVFNLGRSEAVCLSELISALERATGISARVVQESEQPGDAFCTLADISKSRRILRYDPKVSLEEGIRRFVTWYLDQRGKNAD